VVEAFPAQCPDEAFRDRVRPRCSYRSADDADAGTGEHGVERGGELAVPVTEQESESVGAFAEIHQQIAGLLRHPVAGRVGGDPSELRPYLESTAASEALDGPVSGFRDGAGDGSGASADQARPAARQQASGPAPDVADELAQGELTYAGHWLGGSALQCERVVTPTGNITVGRHQIWVGFDHIGRTIGVWVDTTTIHLAYDRIGGPHFKTVPSRLTTAHLARLRAAGATPAGPPPVPRTAARGAATGAVIELDRVVNTHGLITLGGRRVSVGQPLAGQRITLRLEGVVAHVIADGVLARTIPAPVPPELRGRLRAARLATPDQPPTPAATRPVIVQRKVSDRGSTQVAGQKLQVGFAHRNTVVDVHVGDREFRIYDSHGELLATIPKTTTKDVSRYKAYGWGDNIG
jgi:hypothetical protein